MFVLVRWEPVVPDDYPWVIPFWIQLIGIPLHLWTDKNLRKIGSRFGQVDTIELSEGRMLVDVDSRKPLKFKRKAESPDGDEVTIEFKYEMLFKHCTICGLMSHEKGYCPSLKPHIERGGVFARVQIPPPDSLDQNRTNRFVGQELSHQPSLRKFRSATNHSRAVQSRYPIVPRSDNLRNRNHGTVALSRCNRGDNGDEAYIRRNIGDYLS